MAVDTPWWVICQDKRLGRRDLRRVCRNLRRMSGEACGKHAVLRKKNGKLKHEGRRVVALERNPRREIEQQLDDMAYPYASDAARWFGRDDEFDLVAWQLRQEHRELYEAVCAIRRELREQDQDVALELQEVLDELRRQMEKRERVMEAQLTEIETDLRHEREAIPDIYARCRFLRDFTEFLEERIKKQGGSSVTLALWIEHKLEQCRVESLIYA